MSDPDKTNKSPNLSVRIPPEVKAAAQARARERGESLTDVVVRALTRYGKPRR